MCVRVAANLLSVTGPPSPFQVSPKKRIPMRKRLLAAFVRSVREDARPEADVHFHRGPSGDPAVCHDPLCLTPRLSVNHGGRA